MNTNVATKTQWLALAERCENAMEPDRQLDLQLLSAAIGERWQLGTDTVPRYTASIDAITALIEQELPGWFYGSCRGTMRKSHGTFWAEVYFMNGSTEKWLLVDVFGDPIMSPGATEALARCAAFCRAMAANLEIET